MDNFGLVLLFIMVNIDYMKVFKRKTSFSSFLAFGALYTLSFILHAIFEVSQSQKLSLNLKFDARTLYILETPLDGYKLKTAAQAGSIFALFPFLYFFFPLKLTMTWALGQNTNILAIVISFMCGVEKE